MPDRWRSTDTYPLPLLVHCEHSGSGPDAYGDTQYDNTHFDTEEEAWESGRASVEAAVSLAARAVKQAEGQLTRAHAEAAEATKIFHDFIRAEDKRKQGRP